MLRSRFVLLAVLAVAGCGREARSLALLQVAGDTSYPDVTLALEARSYGVYRSLTNVTVPGQGTASPLQVGLYLPGTAEGPVNIDATASQTTADGTCIIGAGTTVVNVVGGEASAPTPLVVGVVTRSCNYDAGNPP